MAMQKWSQRAPFNDWWYWSEQVAKRFRTISEVYRENDEPQRSQETGDWVKKLRENFVPAVTAMRKGLKTEEQKREVKELEEAAIFTAANMLREILMNFPIISSSIQSFLNVDWQKFTYAADAPEIDPETGQPVKVDPRLKKKTLYDEPRLIELFCGPKGREDEGIRSGKFQDGGLPGILHNLLLAEKASSSRAPTDYGKLMQSSMQQQMGIKDPSESMKAPKPGGSI